MPARWCSPPIRSELDLKTFLWQCIFININIWTSIFISQKVFLFDQSEIDMRLYQSEIILVLTNENPAFDFHNNLLRFLLWNPSESFQIDNDWFILLANQRMAQNMIANQRMNLKTSLGSRINNVFFCKFLNLIYIHSWPF